jgi:hypothetical protein
MRVQPTRPAELAEQPEASLAPAGVTPRVKRRQRAHGPRDRVPKSTQSWSPTPSRRWKAVLSPSRSAGRRQDRRDLRPGHVRKGSPGTWETLSPPSRTTAPGSPRPTPYPPTRPAAPKLGENERQGDGTAAQGNERGGGDRESERCMVPRNLGNRPIGTQGREGGAVNCNHWRERWPEHRIRAPSQRNNSG